MPEYQKIKISEQIEKEIFENGTEITWFCNNIINIKAPNPFGTFWSKSYDCAIHNGAYATDHIVRRKKKYVLVGVDRNNHKAGDIWQECQRL